MRPPNLVLGTLLVAGLVACSAEKADDSQQRGSGDVEAISTAKPIEVLAVNYPLAYFAARIGAKEVQVSFPAPRDEDPAYWNPTAEQIAEFQAADLILLNGAGYARWTDRASLPPSKLINTSAGVSDRYISADESVVHAHGPEGAHEHGTLAFTTWLDPTIAVEQARAIRDALSAKRPQAAAGFDSRFQELEQDLLALDADLSAAAEMLAEEPVLGSHPVYQYLAARYDLDMRSVHFEPDEVPDAAGWAELERLQQASPAGLMLWESEPLPDVRRRLETEYGIRSVVFSPCANAHDVDDYMVIMRKNAQRLSVLAD